MGPLNEKYSNQPSRRQGRLAVNTSMMQALDFYVTLEKMDKSRSSGEEGRKIQWFSKREKEKKRLSRNENYIAHRLFFHGKK